MIVECSRSTWGIYSEIKKEGPRHGKAILAMQVKLSQVTNGAFCFVQRATVKSKAGFVLGYCVAGIPSFFNDSHRSKLS
jgi:hypothetical protein